MFTVYASTTYFISTLVFDVGFQRWFTILFMSKRHLPGSQRASPRPPGESSPAHDSRPQSHRGFASSPSHGRKLSLQNLYATLIYATSHDYITSYYLPLHGVNTSLSYSKSCHALSIACRINILCYMGVRQNPPHPI